MIGIYRWENGALREADEAGEDACWINLADPSTDEIDTIQKLVECPREFITDPLDKDERPRLEKDEEYTELIFHVPYHDPDENPIPFHTLPFGIILTPKHVLTICNRQTPVTTTFLDRMRRVCPPEDRYRFIFQILLHSAILYLRYLRDIRQRADMVEQDLHESISNEALMRLMSIEKSLVYFTTSLKASQLLIERLAHTRLLEVPEKDMDILEDVEIEYKQALQMASIHSDILTGTLDTFASVISNNLNNVMKYLTSITIVLMIPTLVASIYGMNIKLPFMDSPHAFIVLMGISLVLGLFSIILLARKKFF